MPHAADVAGPPYATNTSAERPGVLGNASAVASETDRGVRSMVYSSYHNAYPRRVDTLFADQPAQCRTDRTGGTQRIVLFLANGAGRRQPGAVDPRARCSAARLQNSRLLQTPATLCRSAGYSVHKIWPKQRKLSGRSAMPVSAPTGKRSTPSWSSCARTAARASTERRSAARRPTGANCSGC